MNLHRTIGLLEKALQDIGPDNNRARDVRLHIMRALNEARHLTKRQEVRAAKTDQTTPWDQWRKRLDLETGRLVSDYDQKLAVNILDNMISAEQQKLDDLADRKKKDDTIPQQIKGQSDMGTLLG